MMIDLKKRFLDAIEDEGSWAVNDSMKNNTFEDGRWRYKQVNSRITAEVCERVADDFAIGFAEWRDSIKFSDFKINPEYFNVSGEGSSKQASLKSTKELLSIYKSTK